MCYQQILARIVAKHHSFPIYLHASKVVMPVFPKNAGTIHTAGYIVKEKRAQKKTSM